MSSLADERRLARFNHGADWHAKRRRLLFSAAIANDFPDQIALMMKLFHHAHERYHDFGRRKLGCEIDGRFDERTRLHLGHLRPNAS